MFQYRALSYSSTARSLSCSVRISATKDQTARPITFFQKYHFSTTVVLERKAKIMAAPVALEPPSNRGMTFENFDKNAFRLDIDVVAARVPTIQVGKFKKDLAR